MAIWFKLKLKLPGLKLKHTMQHACFGSDLNTLRCIELFHSETRCARIYARRLGSQICQAASCLVIIVAEQALVLPVTAFNWHVKTVNVYFDEFQWPTDEIIEDFGSYASGGIGLLVEYGMDRALLTRCAGSARGHCCRCSCGVRSRSGSS